jgi:hypothetical protein
LFRYGAADQAPMSSFKWPMAAFFKNGKGRWIGAKSIPDLWRQACLKPAF